MRRLSRAITGLELPAIEKISESQQDNPFQVLIATLLSARTQDATQLEQRKDAIAQFVGDDGTTPKRKPAAKPRKQDPAT